MFSIEKLKVYDKALSTVAELVGLSNGWDKRHAVVDQLLRASESVVLNIAEGARLRGTANRQQVLDYAIGSALECAGCLDIGDIKCFLSVESALNQKRAICAVVKMLVGLPEADRGKFLTQAESSTVKAATFLDLCERTGELEGGQRANGLTLLGRVAATLRGLPG